MPTTIYDSSQITQRRRDKTVSGSFINRIQNPTDPSTGSAPYLGITADSIINTVKNGQMTDYRKSDGGCTFVSPGCPCELAQSEGPAIAPGVITTITVSYGSIIVTWDTPSGSSPFTYTVTLTPTTSFVSGLNFQVYDGYFNDNVNLTNVTPILGESGYTSNFTNLGFATNGLYQNGATDPPTRFSVQWTGFFTPSTTATYTFSTTSDDASYVWVGPFASSGFTTGNAIVNNGGTHPSQTQSGTINLTANIPVPIRIQYGESTENQSFSMSVSGGVGTFTSTVPTLTATTANNSYEFPNSQLLPPGNSYYVSVSAANRAGISSPVYYIAGGSLTPVPTRYLPPTMAVTGSTEDTCTIGYLFPLSTYGTGFTVTGATVDPSTPLPAGWSPPPSANNTQIVLTKTTPNPASLSGSYKFILTGDAGEITYPSNAVSGIQTLGYTPNLVLGSGTLTTRTLTFSPAYPGFTITGVVPTPALPVTWSVQSFNNNEIVLEWSGTPPTPSLIEYPVAFIVSGAGGLSKTSNAVSGIEVQVIPPPVLIGATTTISNPDPDIAGLSDLVYPINSFPVLYPNPSSGPYTLSYNSGLNQLQVTGFSINGNSVTSTFSFDAGTSRYICSSDTLFRTTVGNVWFDTFVLPPAGLVGTPMFPNTYFPIEMSTDTTFFSFITPDATTNLCFYQGFDAPTYEIDECWGLYTLSNPTNSSTNLANLVPTPYTTNVNVLQEINDYIEIYGKGFRYGSGSIITSYVNPVLQGTTPTNANFNVRFNNLPPNTTFYLKARTAYNDTPVDDSRIAAASFTGSTYFNPISLQRLGSILFSTNTQTLTGTGSYSGGRQDFTIECFIKMPLVSGPYTLLEGYSGDLQFKLFGESDGSFQELYTRDGNTGWGLPVTTLNTNTWIHYALVRSGSDAGNVSVYINGTRIGQSSIGVYGLNTGNQLRIGPFPAGTKISNLRYTISALYSGASFTRPSTILPVLTRTNTLLQNQENTPFLDIGSQINYVSNGAVYNVEVPT